MSIPPTSTNHSTAYSQPMSKPGRPMPTPEQQAMAIEKLQQDARPSKSRGEAVQRTLTDKVSFTYDAAFGLIAWVGILLAKATFKRDMPLKNTLIGLAFTPLSILWRVASAAVTGKSTEETIAKRVLTSQGIPVNPTETSTGNPTAPAPLTTPGRIA